MICGGNATVFVSDMDAAVSFYTETLGLKLNDRYENEWASIDVGGGMLIGLHPQSTLRPPPGSKGSISVGLHVDEPIEKVTDELARRGVRFSGPIVNDQAVRLAYFTDPDGNELYLCEVDYKY